MFLTKLLTTYLNVSCFQDNTPSNTISCKNSCRNLQDYPTAMNSSNCYLNPDLLLDAPAVIQRYNYTLESYNVTTPDGYILVLFRIPPKSDDFRRGKQPVYLQYGLASESGAWVRIGNDSLAFSLADEGYDVWLGNMRESWYSRKHKTLKESNKKYWEFGWDELAANDIKSSLKEIGRMTGKNGSIIYVGHSKGAALGFMFASEFPEEARELLKGIVALAPAVYIQVDSQIMRKSKLFLSQVAFRNKLNTRSLLLSYCSQSPHVCKEMINHFNGKSPYFLPENLLLYFADFPSAVSKKEILHMMQMVRTGNFQKFDFGKNINVKKYGTVSPPVYNLSAVSVPSYIFYGKHDNFMTEKDMNKLLNQLGNSKTYLYSVPLNNDTEEFQYTHNDFIFAHGNRDAFLKDLLKILTEQLALNLEK